ncbi:MAG: PepSY domain-containing protein [Rhizobiales bacterium]|nr:PepSY domain-containing protein [Hyphomicrobiales bacterium]
MQHFGKFVPVLLIGLLASSSTLADGYKDCTKAERSSWKPAAEAEAKAKAAGYEVQRSKIEGTCYEVYAKREGKLYELFYSPQDLSLKHTKTRKN